MEERYSQQTTNHLAAADRPTPVTQKRYMVSGVVAGWVVKASSLNVTIFCA